MSSQENRKFFISDDGKEKISLDLTEVKAGLESGTHQKESLAWTKGMSEWLPLSDPFWEKYEIRILSEAETTSPKKPGFGKWKNKLTDVQGKMAEAKEKVSEAAPSMDAIKEKASGFTPSLDSMKSKLSDTLGEINAIKPIFNENGFAVSDIEMVISVPPSLAVIIDNQANNIEGLNQSVEAFGELTKIQQMMIGTIRKISELQGVVSKSGHKIGEIEIQIGFPPSITVHLPPVEPPFGGGGKVEQ